VDDENRFAVNPSALRNVSVGEACQLIDGLVMGIMEAYPDLGAVEQYRRIAEALPDRVDQNLQRGLLKKAQQGHNNQATTAFLMLNLKTVFIVTDQFRNGDPERDNELVCAGIGELLARLPDINGEGQFHVQVDYAVHEGIVAYLEQNEGVNPGFTRFGATKQVQEAADGLLAAWPWGASKSRLRELADDLVNHESYPANAPGTDTVLAYLIRCMEENSDVPEEWIDVEEEVSRILRSKEVVKQMARLPERERQILEMYFWGNKTLEEIGDNLGFTRDTVRGIWGRALRSLRHPTKSGALR